MCVVSSIRNKFEEKLKLNVHTKVYLEHVTFNEVENCYASEVLHNYTLGFLNGLWYQCQLDQLEIDDLVKNLHVGNKLLHTRNQTLDLMIESKAKLKGQLRSVENLLETWKVYADEQKNSVSPNKEADRILAMAKALERALMGEFMGFPQNAVEFIQQHDFKKTKEVIEYAPSTADLCLVTPMGNLIFYKKVDGSFPEVEGRAKTELEVSDYLILEIPELKRLVESVELIKFYGGIERAKLLLAMGTCLADRPPHAREVQLKQAIADYEAIGGEHV
ncbi:hypothetical protein F971_01959 [Acinetobacter vivianii]|uniref:Uncharacterized protein n=1 Tax=Acinetobacter vivianii TaxID=1776742 RepID=N8W9V2_9GAMM|nr:hypothetical protein [Acinetobacter vivianii]ENU92072.1 hypothetical protein F971_01959 [Acinetobacter vivianii]